MPLGASSIMMTIALSVAEGRRIMTSPESAFNLGSSKITSPRGDLTYYFASNARRGQPVMGSANSKPTGLVWPSPEAEKKVRTEDGIVLYPTHAWADGMKPVVKASHTMLSTPFIVGVAADSGCGKSTFLKRIMGSLKTDVTPGHTAIGDQMTVVCLDDYHINDRAGRKATGLTALDAKENDFALMGAQMEALREGKAVYKPIYNHDTGFKDEPELIQPNDLMIFEGLHPIYDEKARRQLDLSIYIDIVNEVKFAWKVQRDVAERGWTEAQVKEDIEKRLPDFSEYVDPQKTEADIILRYEPSDNGLPGLKVKLIQVFAVRPLPHTKGHPGWSEGFQMVQLVGGELKLKHATLKSYIEPWGDWPFAEVLEMDGVLDKDNMEAELKKIEDNLAGLRTTIPTELTDSMMALKDSPGSLDGTGVFQNIIALQVRDMFEAISDNSFRKRAQRLGVHIPLSLDMGNEPDDLEEAWSEDDKKQLMLDLVRGAIADKNAREMQEARILDPVGERG